jgi:PAS domain S-box-containing protein
VGGLDSVPGDTSALRALLECSPDYVVIGDREGKPVAFNSAYAGLVRQALGLEMKPGLQPQKRLDDPLAIAFWEQLYRRVLSGEKFVTEYAHRFGPEDLRYFEISFAPIVRDGRVQGFVEMSRDITDRKRTEQTLARGDETWRVVLDALDFTVMIIDNRGRVLLVNEAACQRQNKTREQLIGASASELQPVEVAQEARNHAIEAMTTGKVNRFETTADGRIYDVTIYPIKEANGGVERLAVITREITQLRLTERELRRSREEWENIFQAVGHPTLILDTNHEIIAANNAAAQAAGILTADLVGRKCYQVFHGADHAPTLCPLERMLTTGAVETVEMEMEALGGYYLISCTPVTDDQGRVSRVIHIATDITERRRVEEALRLTQFSVDSLADAAFWLGPDAKFIYVNDSACQGLGYSREELLSMTVHDINPDFPAEVWPDHWDEIRRRKSFTAQSRHRTKSGEFIPVEITVNHVAFGGREYNCTFARDITDRLRIEKEVWAEKERFRTLADESPLGVSFISRDGRYEYLNPKFQEMFGYTLADIPTGRDWFEKAFPDPDYRDGVIASWIDDEKKSRVGESRPRVFMVRCRDGGDKVIHFRSVTLAEGQQLVICEDITERQRAEEAIRESEARFRELFDSISDYIFTHDLEGRLLTVNPATALGLGYSTEELVGRYISDFLRPKNSRAFHDDYLPEIRRRGRFRGVIVFRSRDGSERYFEYNNTLVTRKGAPDYVSGVGRDITERVLAERELRDLEERLAQSQKMEAIGTLASGIAHDFNNILQAVTGYVELMLNKKQTPAFHQENLLKVDLAAQRASELVRRLLTFGRKAGLERHPVNLNDEIQQTVRLLERTIPKMIGIQTRLAKDLKSVNADPRQIEQILMNLGINAGDAMPGGGTLTIETANVHLDERYSRTHPDAQPGDYVRLKVTDTGHGMDQETGQHIFEPFFTTKGVGEGTGLGLSTVYGIVTGHGGSITCQSRPGRGTTFKIYLPAVDTPADASVARAEDTGEPVRGRETILLVDDEQPILETAREYLTEHGYTAITASSGEEALKTFRKKKGSIDLVILDLGMPGMGGRECLKKLLERDPGIKVVVATGYISSGLETDLRRDGAVGYVAKPYRLSDLMRAVKEALSDI